VLFAVGGIVLLHLRSRVSSLWLLFGTQHLDCLLAIEALWDSCIATSTDSGVVAIGVALAQAIVPFTFPVLVFWVPHIHWRRLCNKVEASCKSSRGVIGDMLI